MCGCGVQTKHYDADERFMATKDLLDQVSAPSSATHTNASDEQQQVNKTH
jgi:hypothetical protein